MARIASLQILLSITALIFTACAPSAQTSVAMPAASSAGNLSGIVNGVTAAANDVANGGVAQSVVMIITQLKGSQALCSGTLIAPRIVLTAGHCVGGAEVGNAVKPADVLVILHVLNPTQISGSAPPPGVSGYRVQDFAVNTAFSDQGLNNQDLAIILLEKPVIAGTPIASLPSASLDYTQIPQIMSIGYGVSDDRHNTTEANSGAGTLRYTTFPNDKFQILPASAGAGPSRTGMLIALSDTTSMCNGDSGGPVMALAANGQSSNMVVAVNESVIPSYKGQEQTDYVAAEKANNIAPFYEKYPDAATCSGGYNLAVSVTAMLPWINSTASALLAEPPPPVAVPAPAPAQSVAQQK